MKLNCQVHPYVHSVHFLGVEKLFIYYIKNKNLKHPITHFVAATAL